MKNLGTSGYVVGTVSTNWAARVGFAATGDHRFAEKSTGDHRLVADLNFAEGRDHRPSLSPHPLASSSLSSAVATRAIAFAHNCRSPTVLVRQFAHNRRKPHSHHLIVSVKKKWLTENIPDFYEYHNHLL
ncbi:hypothetical protein RIF29_14108 [Crotalaria pallida]|uniref:Uncharacterized protein n=1 Tax=Crotalaria pallida TaxID=3830 RepID=A0AAN9FAT2_CROPI